LSHRYIPARQLPDKAVSLLDTACARVAISQTTIPAMVEDTRISIARREAERAALVSDSDLGSAEDARIAELDAEIAGLKERLELLDAEWATEKGVVEKIQGLWAKLTGKKETTDAGVASEASSPPDTTAPAEEAAPSAGDDADSEDSRKLLRESFEALEARAPGATRRSGASRPPWPPARRADHRHQNTSQRPRPRSRWPRPACQEFRPHGGSHAWCPTDWC
jgi:type VI secretion system protein VasG